MKTTLIIFGIVVLISVLILLFFGSSDETKSELGNISDVGKHLDSLMKSSNEYGLLIIEVQGTENFIQFTGSKNGVQLDHPLITDRQKELESSFKDVANHLALTVIENKGSDGSTFLDVDLKGNSSEIAIIVIKFMERFFKINTNSRLVFKYDY